MKEKENSQDSVVRREERLRLILTYQEDINPDLLLTDREVAELLNCSLASLQNGRKDGRRKGKVLGPHDLPPHKVLFGKMVRYRYGDLLAWVDANSREPEGYIRPATPKTGNDSMSETRRLEKGAPNQSMPPERLRSKGWKAQVLDALLANGIITKRYTGTITLDIENGALKGALKQEQL